MGSNLFYAALQRDPTSTELTTNVNSLAAAGAQGYTQLLSTATTMARGLFTQTSYESSRSDTQFVTDTYYAYAQRGPDDAGLSFWVGQLSQGRAHVCDAMEASGEFQTLVSTLFGTATSDNQRTEQIVNNFYLGAYGRNATSTELQSERDALNAAAAQGVASVQSALETFGRGLFAAQVTDGSITNQQFVTNVYEAFLQRGPDTAGLNFWSSGTKQWALDGMAASTAFRDLAATLYREEFWLVDDHLGTPRMIVDKSGSLSGVKRHDYLPFGEEIFAGIGSRATGQGYTGDSTRQHFTGYEMDGESGLNFAQARYQSPTQGRFTSVDPLGASANAANPQSFNRYSYVQNSPTNATDPSGMMMYDASMGWGDVAGMWQGGGDGSHFGAFENGQSIIASAEAQRDALVQGRLDEMLALHYLQETAQRQDNDKLVSVKKKKYEKTSDGLRIRLRAKVKGSTYTHFNWVQTVTTPDPLNGNPANQPYPDTDPGQQTPFYWNPTEQTAYENMAQAEGASTIFSDTPSRPYSATDISWHANLALVGIKSDGTFETLRSYSYGFTIDAHGVHLEKLRRIP